MLTAGPRGQFPRWRRSRKRLSVCFVLRCSDLWLQCSVSFVHGAPARCVFYKPCTKLTLHCNHRSRHLKTEHTESLFLLRRHLGNWPRSKHEKQTAGSAWETWTVATADGVRCARVGWEINFLLTFETAPFFCVYPVYTGCPRRNVPDFGRVFLMLKYADITQNTYIQSWTVTEIMAREVW